MSPSPGELKLCWRIVVDSRDDGVGIRSPGRSVERPVLQHVLSTQLGKTQGASFSLTLGPPLLRLGRLPGASFTVDWCGPDPSNSVYSRFVSLCDTLRSTECYAQVRPKPGSVVRIYETSALDVVSAATLLRRERDNIGSRLPAPLAKQCKQALKFCWILIRSTWGPLRVGGPQGARRAPRARC